MVSEYIPTLVCGGDDQCSYICAHVCSCGNLLMYVYIGVHKFAGKLTFVS